MGNVDTAVDFTMEYFRSSHFSPLNVAQLCVFPVKNVTGVFLCLFDSRLVENETESDGNPIIFLANAMETPWLELVQNPCHVPAWKTNTAWMNDMELSWIWCGFEPHGCRFVTENGVEFP